MRKGPCELRIDVEIELSPAQRCDDLVCAVAVVLKEPIGLIKTMLAHQRRGLHGQLRRCVRNGTERRVVDAPQAIRRVQRFGGAQERRVGRSIRSDDELRALPGRREAPDRGSARAWSRYVRMRAIASLIV
jgi:hypothetical protein